MAERRPLNVLDDDDADDPILSVVNIIDAFLVIIAVLLVAVIENPLNPFTLQNALVIKDPGEPTMEMVVKKGDELTRYKSSGQIGEGEGAKAGTAYRLKDGRMIYVPE
ncbi:DUF2149 domain-containing protein [Oryzomicrobium sp.]|uniref:DUF2149 domain-containing protein n=1 Tax=Oryzomicrobium sp. TaxID=1911578 RepID=UPI0025F2C4AC|nr:DUF2149 domain-containing protein [Oryzomicrobium sp.]MCE1243679.1 DUF2149 domain-containing protein [Oryzomicrobium sp.]